MLLGLLLVQLVQLYISTAILNYPSTTETISSRLAGASGMVIDSDGVFFIITTAGLVKIFKAVGTNAFSCTLETTLSSLTGITILNDYIYLSTETNFYRWYNTLSDSLGSSTTAITGISIDLSYIYIQNSTDIVRFYEEPPLRLIRSQTSSSNFMTFMIPNAECSVYSEIKEILFDLNSYSNIYLRLHFDNNVIMISILVKYY